MKSSHLPILSYPNELIGLKKAAWFARRDIKTIRLYCRLYGIFLQVSPSAPIEVSKPGLAMVIHGDFVALELLRAGNRTHPRVARYLDWVGIPE